MGSKTKGKRPDAAPVAPSLPAPGQSEREAIEIARNRTRARRPRVAVRIAQEAGQKVDVGPDHSDHAGWLSRLQDALGSRGTAFPISQLNQLIMAATDENAKVDGTRVNAMLAMIEAARPENEIQAALAVQMAITHFATLTVMRRALRVDQIPQFDSAAGMTVKLARTFALQAETLARLQRGGEQLVKVVHVHPGAQAIVGNVTTSANGATGGGGGGSFENRNQPHAKALPAAAGAGELLPMRCADPEREPLPVAKREG